MIVDKVGIVNKETKWCSLHFTGTFYPMIIYDILPALVKDNPEYISLQVFKTCLKLRFI